MLVALICWTKIGTNVKKLVNFWSKTVLGTSPLSVQSEGLLAIILAL